MISGYFLRKLIDDTEAKINGTSDKQIVIHSGHDVTILNLFVILDIANFPKSPVGSYCTWEVHQINGIYGFKVSINYKPYFCLPQMLLDFARLLMCSMLMDFSITWDIMTKER